MNNEEIELNMGRAAAMIAFGVSATDIAAIFRAEGNDEEAIFLLVAAGRILAR